MKKDFESWHFIKKELNERNINKEIFYKPREIWVCAVGANIGSEQDGQGSDFSRPVLVFKVFNLEMFLGIPITMQTHDSNFHFRFNLGGADQFAILSQIRLFSVKRLQRKIVVMPDYEFNALFQAFTNILPQNEVPLSGEISEAEAIVN